MEALQRNAQKEFRFGIEAEYLLVDVREHAPLWHDSLSFPSLNRVLESISFQHDLALDGLERKPPMEKILPFVVEGYYVLGERKEIAGILPKGLEIRTPVTNSIESCLRLLKALHKNLQEAGEKNGWKLCSLSHHPLHSRFSGPQNESRYDHWQWGMEVMTTYGPDINFSLPGELRKTLDSADLLAKVDYYGPALAALTVAAPFCENGPWKIRGQVGKSFRMHKRSYIAPAVELHDDGRIEFKLFDMPGSLREFEAMMLASLALVLDDTLMGRASKQSRIYDLGSVARHGIRAEGMEERAAELLRNAPIVLSKHGFSSAALELFQKRLETKTVPADDLLRIYARENKIADVLRERSELL
ncbi:MAG TPA: glutamate-cysteine ligase family protein [Bdellovibrionota bacterium]|jgi:carboxylate-amine ligase